MDAHLYNNDGMFPEASTYYYPYFRHRNNTNPGAPGPDELFSDTVDGYFGWPHVVPTMAPFVLYFLGALASLSALLMVANTALWQKFKGSGGVQGLSLAMVTASFVMISVSFVAYFIAIGLLNSRMDRIINARTPNDDDTMSGGHAFLAFAWCAVFAQAVASIMMYRVLRRRWKGRQQGSRRGDHAREVQSAEWQGQMRGDG
jgi:hypothetical protein